MKNKFIKSLCSFQIAVNVIGMPIYMELKSVTEQTSKYIRKTNTRLLCDIYT